ncbi:MAG TPA: hypothetical protein ENH82_08935 [bacterium]|nr:hypothetical protein [bacterium]
MKTILIIIGLTLLIVGCKSEKSKSYEAASKFYDLSLYYSILKLDAGLKCDSIKVDSLNEIQIMYIAKGDSAFNSAESRLWPPIF